MLKKRIRNLNDKNSINLSILASIFLVGVLSFVSIGFALYSQELNIKGTVSFGGTGKLAITDVQLVNSTLVEQESIPAFTDDEINFNLTFQKRNGSNKKTEYEATYNIKISNTTLYDYDISFADYVPRILNSSNREASTASFKYEITGINVGETIRPNEEKTATITIRYNPTTEDTYKVVGNLNLVSIEKPNGSILASIPKDTSINLRKSQGNITAKTTVSIINSYKMDKEVSLSINNDNFELVNEDGTKLDSVIVSSEGMAEKDIYVKLKNNVIFSSDEVTTGISLTTTDGLNINCGSLKIFVDMDERYKDTTPPIISNVKAEIQKAISENTSVTNAGSIRITWSVDDENVNHYTILMYSVVNQTETLINEFTTEDRYYTVSNVNDGTYVFKVYGTDSSINKNTASESDIKNATNNPGYCSKSLTSVYDWHFNVVLNLTNATSSDTIKKVNRGYDYTTTLTPSSNYTLPSSIIVKMDNMTLESGSSMGQYQYNASTGKLVVYGVTGDLDITAAATRNGGGCGL